MPKISVSSIMNCLNKEPVTVWVCERTYYLGHTVEFDSKLSGSPEKGGLWKKSGLVPAWVI